MKRLYRDQDDRKLAGICAGVAKYFNIDPTLVRIITVAVFFMTGGFPVLFAYIIGAFIIPNEGDY
ncbi:phage-shock protein [Alkalihalobacillus alcalophilus ATCC 27647 = CGMCC 1.3604]|uniref:Membrane protein n=1 Tax=Alkalihalobacillus alcalophilus ATCC 27647 = CGMCC 1.3604 TaxID=1218173 RepID=A0A094YQA7_ALKAL|nr:PspC domain-containing protein [Alkalihalobacillus alcalophilus]KGA95657.1 membrane protein [Alkalihalobacillus alcalophilus ATCC 27647 = CGMCC 1.3604]MED1564072.1 PspC domain-containing protein [Alkalihalobacillus alcalophilus]THG89505.1 phage-shock protein [Alkalihalobacillus alcalophilus ATCC 27647 = CGMCC 1.3604]